MTKARKGNQFVHKSFRDPLKSHDASARALMRITCVRKGKVYYTYANEEGDKAAFYLDREVWEERYGND